MNDRHGTRKITINHPLRSGKWKARVLAIRCCRQIDPKVAFPRRTHPKWAPNRVKTNDVEKGKCIEWTLEVSGEEKQSFVISSETHSHKLQTQISQWTMHERMKLSLSSRANREGDVETKCLVEANGTHPPGQKKFRKRENLPSSSLTQAQV
ncbi:hypothetical protein KQX54_019751 [Cotesia glomerata]|uniref:Uncharacterized protein n=1 Tax=Cotesia glomerata TaxID=32391 RepID=A0AAV7J257_COTGL|nr:hypothetical protein KQX54_019751 [Cotesia glomerata]